MNPSPRFPRGHDPISHRGVRLPHAGDVRNLLGFHLGREAEVLEIHAGRVTIAVPPELVETVRELAPHFRLRALERGVRILFWQTVPKKG